MHSRMQAQTMLYLSLAASCDQVSFFVCMELMLCHDSCVVASGTCSSATGMPHDRPFLVAILSVTLWQSVSAYLHWQKGIAMVYSPEHGR
jgi:hypothetical protein